MRRPSSSPSHARHHVIEQGEIEGRQRPRHARVQRVERCLGAIDAERLHAEVRKLPAQHFAVRGIVVDDEHAADSRVSAASGRAASCFLERNAENCA